MKSRQAKVQSRLRALVQERVEALTREQEEKRAEARRLEEEVRKARRREQDKQRRLERKIAEQEEALRTARRKERARLRRLELEKADPVEFRLKPVKARIRRFLNELETGAGDLVHIEERKHPYFCVKISSFSMPNYLLTIGMNGGRIAPGPKFETHKELFAYLNEVFLDRVAEAIAEAQFSRHIMQPDDEVPETNHGDEEIVCGGSHEVAETEASDQSNYSSSFFCSQCGEQFDLEDLVEEDEQIDSELESMGVEPSMLIPEHAPAVDSDDG